MSKKQLPNPDDMTFESAAEELHAIVKRIDEGKAELETMMEDHKRGQLLVTRCKYLLEDAQQQIKNLEVKDLQ